MSWNDTLQRINRTTLILLALIAFQAISHGLWLAMDDRLVNWDPSRYLRSSLGIWQVLSDPGPSRELMIIRLGQLTDKVEPPLAPIAALPFYAIFGFDADAATAANIGFLALLILATYGSGKELYGRQAGLLAAFLISFTPLVAAYTRIFYLDLPLAAMVTLNLYALLRTEDFADRRWSLLYGLTLGAGLLTKKSFVIFIAGPALLVVVRSLLTSAPRSAAIAAGRAFSPRDGWKGRLTHLLLALVLGLVMSVPWYSQRLEHIFSQIEEGGDHGGPLWLYLTWLDDDLFLPGLALLLGGVALALRRRDRRALFPLTWFLTGLLLHSLLQRGHTRYILPLLPAAALLSAWWVVEIGRPRLRRSLLAATLLVFFANYALLSWLNPAGLAPRLGLATAEPLDRPFDRTHNSALWVAPKAVWHAYPPRGDLAWPLDEILATIWADNQATGTSAEGRLPFFMIGNVSGYNRGMMSYVAMRQEIESQGLEKIEVHGGGVDAATLPDLLDFPYLLDKTEPTGYDMADFSAMLAAILAAQPQRYRQIAAFPLPDGSQATLYRRDQLPLAGLSDGGQTALAESWLALGEIHRAAGRADQAASAFNRARELSPADPRVALALGRLYLDQERAGEAVTVLQAALQAAPADANLHAALGDAYIGQAEDPQALDRAEAEYRRALELDEANIAAHAGLAGLYARFGRPDEASAAYRQAAELAAGDQQQWLTVSEALLRIDRTGEALTVLQQAAAGTPGAPDTLLPLAATLEEAGETDAALALYEQILAQSAANFAALNAVARIHEQRGDCQQALAAWQRLAQTRQTARIASKIGDAYRTCNDLDAAMAAYEQALDLDPDWALAHFGLGQLYDQQGQTARAAQEFRIVVDLGANELLASQARNWLQEHSE